MKKGLAIIMSLMLGLLCVGCSSGQTQEKTEETTQPQNEAEAADTEDVSEPEAKEIKVGVSFMTLNSPFFEAMQKGVEEEAKAAGVEVFRMPS